MRRFGLDIRLEEDVVLSARPATAGGHEGLDYLPGQALLGACAARLYRALDAVDAWLVFHSGRVRFGDGLPTAGDGAVGHPMPLALHEAKTEPAVRGGRLDPARAANLAHPQGGECLPAHAQPRQLRAGHLTPDGRVLAPRRALRMKSAIDPATGRAREAHLFGYEALCAGQRFHAVIEADEEVPEALFERVREALTGELLLGRSRSAEYGRVRAEPVAPRLPQQRPAAPGAALTLWLLSDLALLDGHGQPTLEPAPEWLGLGPGRIDWTRTFLRTRAYAPWNAHRNAYDLERAVIARGSVVRLELEDAPSPETVERLRSGCGLHREAGLGRIWIDPPLLADGRPRLAPPPQATAGGDGAAAPVPDDPLLAWAEAWLAQAAGDAKVEKLARGIAARLRECYERARAEAGIGREGTIGPSPAQWGNLHARAKQGGAADPREALFGPDDPKVSPQAGAACPAHAPGWTDRFFADGRMQNFREWLRDALVAAWETLGGGPARQYRLAAEVARRGREVARRLHERGETDA